MTTKIKTKPNLGAKEYEITWQGESRIMRIVWWKTEAILKLIFSVFMELQSNPNNLIKYLSLSEEDRDRVKNLSEKIKDSKNEDEIKALQEELDKILSSIKPESQISLNETVINIMMENVNKILSICLSEKDKGGYSFRVTEDEIRENGDPAEIMEIVEHILEATDETLKNAPRVIEKAKKLMTRFA